MKTYAPDKNGKREIKESEYIDMKMGLEMVAGKRELYKNLLVRFAKSGYKRELMGAWQHRDKTQLRRQAHMLRGIAGGLALTDLYAQSKGFEEKLRRGALTNSCFYNLLLSLENTLICIENIDIIEERQKPWINQQY